MKNKILCALSVIVYMLGVESTTTARPFLLLAGLAGGLLCAVIACMKENKKN